MVREGEIKFLHRMATRSSDDLREARGLFLRQLRFREPYTTRTPAPRWPADENAEPPGYWSLYRWHIEDPICYERRSPRGPSRPSGGVLMASTRSCRTNIASVPTGIRPSRSAPFPALRRWPIALRLKQPPYAVPGVLEGENLKVLKATETR